MSDEMFCKGVQMFEQILKRNIYTLLQTNIFFMYSGIKLLLQQQRTVTYKACLRQLLRY